VLLARIVAACTPADGDLGALGTLEPPVPWLDYDHAARSASGPARVWPPPASPRWDPHRIEADLPPLILEFARRSRARLLAADARALPRVVGHGDLSGINARWYRDGDGDQPAGIGAWRTVVHDWDSVVALPDAVIAGVGAADHASTDACRLAGLADGAVLLDAYAAQRGRPWTRVEREVAWAAGTWVVSYNAAFEHLKHGRAGEGTAPVTDGLLLDGEQRLALAAA